MESPETAKPPPRPRPLPGASRELPGPAVAISYLHTFLRHGGGGAGSREGPHCALGAPLPGRARGSSSRAGQGAGPPGGPALPPRPPLSLSITGGDRVDGALWLRPGSASALAPQTRAGARGLHPAAERADLGRWRRRGLCNRSHVPTLRGVRVFTSLVGAGPPRKAAANFRVPFCPRSPTSSLALLPSLGNEDLGPVLALSPLNAAVSSFRTSVYSSVKWG